MCNSASRPFIAVFSVLLAAPSIVEAEIPKYMARQLQDRSPEQLLIEVTKVEKKRSLTGTFDLNVGAQVLEVEKSATGLKAGDDLSIRYWLHDPEKPLPPGSYPIELENGKVYRVYLSQAGMLKGVYSPKAASASFVGAARPAPSPSKLPETRPNIVLIMGDDIGFADLGCFGSEIDTPNLDRLAERGMRFTQAYNMAKCEPTRSAMLTGTFWSNRNAQSLGALLGKAEYTTINCGKEHFHAWVPERCKAMNSFQRSFTHYGGAGSFFRQNATRFHLDRERIAIDDMELSGPYYKTRAITDYAITFLKETKSKQAPFFLYVAYEAAHSPIHPLKEDFEKYQGRYLKGWDHMREQRFAKQQRLGILEPGTKLSPPHGLHYSRGNPYIPWNEVAESDRQRFDAQMAGFAGMVHCMDRNIGRIVDTIREMGQLDNTLILYLSDNGSCPFTNGKGKPVSGEDTPRKEVRYITVMDGGLGYKLPNLDAKWANVGNTPYRQFKQAGHEGGARTHLIAHWPKVISPGEIHRSPVHVVDFMPTFLQLAKTEYPTKADGAISPELDGSSLLPAFQGKPTNPKRLLITGHTDNQRKIRFGDWAIVKLKYSASWELYNLREDPAELNDLAAEMSEEVSSLETLYEDWKIDREVGGFNTRADTTVDK